MRMCEQSIHTEYAQNIHTYWRIYKQHVPTKYNNWIYNQNIEKKNIQAEYKKQNVRTGFTYKMVHTMYARPADAKSPRTLEGRTDFTVSANYE